MKDIRKLNGLTQEELSAKSGVPLRLVRAYEQGQIKTSNAEHQTMKNLGQALRAYSL